MPPQLLAITEGQSILLDKPILLLGRHQECDIQLPSRKVSRRHCCIAQVGDHLVVRDLGSTNGIRINGVRVFEGSLRAGDELTIGNYRYQVSWDSIAPGTGRSARSAGADKGPAAKPRPGRPDDEDLEYCEEPVPLAEPSGARPLPARKPPAEGTVAAKKDADEPAPPEPRSLVLPDNLELAPSSDVVDPEDQEPKPAP
jgi:predicted component of type VI protein secretion system